jgi:hypothetical protein
VTVQPTRQNVVPIHQLPRHIERLPIDDAIAWVVEATQLTLYQVLTSSHLVRERLLAAVTRERRAARKRRMVSSRLLDQGPLGERDSGR